LIEKDKKNVEQECGTAI